MAAQFGRAPLASLPALDFWTGAASVRPLLRAPLNVRLYGRLSRSLSGAQVPYPSTVGRWDPFAMAEEVTSAAFLFAAARGHLPEISVVENGGPRLVEPGEAPSKTVAPETFGVTV